MAQWIRRLPTEQEILGSSPGRVKYFFLDLSTGVYSVLFVATETERVNGVSREQWPAY